MRISSAVRIGVVALTAMASSLSLAYAGNGRIQLSVVQAGVGVGGSSGFGTLFFHKHRYPLSVGGPAIGFLLGSGQSDLVGEVRNIRSAADVTGLYSAAGAGIAIGQGGERSIVLRNEKGAELRLSGRQQGLIANLDLGSLVISLR